MWDPKNGIPTQNWFLDGKIVCLLCQFCKWKTEGVVKDIKINWRELFQSSSNGGSDGVCQINQMCSLNLFLSNFLFCDFNRVHSSEEKNWKKFLLLCEVACVCRNNCYFAMDKVLIKFWLFNRWWIRRSSMFLSEKFWL